jgi:hypothetical protein
MRDRVRPANVEVVSDSVQLSAPLSACLRRLSKHVQGRALSWIRLVVVLARPELVAGARV